MLNTVAREDNRFFLPSKRLLRLFCGLPRIRPLLYTGCCCPLVWSPPSLSPFQSAPLLCAGRFVSPSLFPPPPLSGSTEGQGQGEGRRGIKEGGRGEEEKHTEEPSLSSPFPDGAASSSSSSSSRCVCERLSFPPCFRRDARHSLFPSPFAVVVRRRRKTLPFLGMLPPPPLPFYLLRQTATAKQVWGKPSGEGRKKRRKAFSPPPPPLFAPPRERESSLPYAEGRREGVSSSLRRCQCFFPKHCRNPAGGGSRPSQHMRPSDWEGPRQCYWVY